MFFKNLKKVIFIGAHTDDEMIVAGTLNKLVNQGIIVKVMTLSYAPIPGASLEETSAIVRPEFLTAMQAIGISEDNAQVLGFNPRDIPESLTKIRQKIFDFVEAEKPDLSFILSSEDDHQDHSALGRACQIVMKNRIPNIVRCHYPWNFVPSTCNLVVPLSSEELEVKFNVVKAYKSQHFRYDYESLFRSSVELNGFSTKNKPSEAFEILRLTVRGE